MLIQSSACHIVNSFSMSGSGCLPSSFRRFDWSSRVPAADAKKARRYIYICTQYYTHTYIYIYTHIYIYIFIHSFILETYIAPLQETTTQRRNTYIYVLGWFIFVKKKICEISFRHLNFCVPIRVKTSEE